MLNVLQSQGGGGEIPKQRTMNFKAASHVNTSLHLDPWQTKPPASPTVSNPAKWGVGSRPGEAGVCVCVCKHYHCVCEVEGEFGAVRQSGRSWLRNGELHRTSKRQRLPDPRWPKNGVRALPSCGRATQTGPWRLRPSGVWKQKVNREKCGSRHNV